LNIWDIWQRNRMKKGERERERERDWQRNGKIINAK
jgi:hypothetical protein